MVHDHLYFHFLLLCLDDCLLQLRVSGHLDMKREWMRKEEDSWFRRKAQTFIPYKVKMFCFLPSQFTEHHRQRSRSGTQHRCTQAKGSLWTADVSDLSINEQMALRCIHALSRSRKEVEIVNFGKTRKMKRMKMKKRKKKNQECPKGLRPKGPSE
jgi:hypothetical protein